jgi:DNA-binding response OmpR family regulator
MRVLVVDDDPSVRGLIRDVLEMEGYEVALAEDGLAALLHLEAERVDLVILDVMMPGMDGHAVLARIREVHGAALPVIMLTAAADDSQQWQAWAGGVDWFLAKPFDADALLRYLEYLTGQKAVPAAG